MLKEIQQQHTGGVSGLNAHTHTHTRTHYVKRDTTITRETNPSIHTQVLGKDTHTHRYVERNTTITHGGGGASGLNAHTHTHAHALC